MTTNTAPSPNFTGINFNLDFFPSEAGDFVTYPVAQGPTTIGTLYSSVIDTLSSSTSFNLLNSLTANLNIAVNGAAGQTIRIGAISGASIHCANVDFQGNSINHSTNASGGTINLCNNMTSGTLNIGTNTARTGTINIGDGVGATGAIDIGSSTTSTTVGGTLTSTGQITASNGLTLASGKYITTGHTGTITAPTSAQVGYTQSVSYALPTIPTSTQIITMNTITLSQGTWILTGAVSLGSTQSVTHGYISFGDTSRPVSIAPTDATDSVYGNTSFVGATVSNRVTPNLTVYVSPTVRTIYYFNISLTYSSAPGFNSNFWKLYAMRIA